MNKIFRSVSRDGLVGNGPLKNDSTSHGPATPIFMSQRRKNKTFSSFSVGSAFKSLRIKKQQQSVISPPPPPLQKSINDRAEGGTIGNGGVCVKKKGFFRSGLDVLFHNNQSPVVAKELGGNFRKSRSYHHICANQVSPTSPKCRDSSQRDHYYCKKLVQNGDLEGSSTNSGGRRSAEPRVNFWVNRKASASIDSSQLCESKWKVCGKNAIPPPANDGNVLMSGKNQLSPYQNEHDSERSENFNFDNFGDNCDIVEDRIESNDKSSFTDGFSNNAKLYDDNFENGLNISSPRNTTHSLTIKERLQLKELLEKLDSQDINTDSFKENELGFSPSNTLSSLTGIRTNGSLPRDQKISPVNNEWSSPNSTQNSYINHSDGQYCKITPALANVDNGDFTNNMATKSFSMLDTNRDEKICGRDISDNEINLAPIPDVLKSNECAKFLDRIVGERAKIGNNIKSLAKYLQDVQQQHQEIAQKMGQERQAIEAELREQIENVFKEQKEIQEYQKVCREYLESLELQRDEKRKILNKLQENINKDEKYVKNYTAPQSPTPSNPEENKHANGHESENGHHILEESFESDLKAFDELEFQILELDGRIEEEKERAIDKIDSHKERFLQKFQYTQERINVIDPSKLETLNKFAINLKQVTALENQLQEVLKLEQTKFQRLDAVLNSLTNTGADSLSSNNQLGDTCKAKYSCSQIPTPSDITSQPSSPNPENRDEFLRKRASEEIKTFWRDYLCSNREISPDLNGNLNSNNFQNSNRPKDHWDQNFKTLNFSNCPLNGRRNSFKNFSRSNSFRHKEHTEETVLDLSRLNVNQRLTDIFNEKLKHLDEELSHLQKVEKPQEFISNPQHLVNFNPPWFPNGPASPISNPTTQTYISHQDYCSPGANCDNLYSRVTQKKCRVDDGFSVSTPSPNSYPNRNEIYQNHRYYHPTKPEDEEQPCEKQITIYDSATPSCKNWANFDDNRPKFYGTSSPNRPGLVYSSYATSGGNSINYDLRIYLTQSAGHSLDMYDKYLCVTKMGARGYLQKLGMKFKIWKKRWFIFDKIKRNITYYDDKSEGKIKGVIYFQAIEEVYVDHMSSFKAPTKDASFCLKTFDKLYYLSAPNPDVMRIWVDILLTGVEGQTIYKNYEN